MKKLTIYWIDDEFRKIYTQEESLLVSMVNEATKEHTLVPFPTSKELICAVKKSIKEEAAYPDVIYFDFMLGERLATQIQLPDVKKDVPDGIVLARYVRQLYADANRERPPLIGCSVEPFTEQWGQIKDIFDGYICKDDKLQSHFVSPSYETIIQRLRGGITLLEKAKRREAEIATKNKAVL